MTASPARRLGGAALALFLAALPARPATEGLLAITLTVVNGRAVAALDLSAVFGPSRQPEFGNGLNNLVEIYTSVVPANGGTPSAIHGRIIEILYDVWEETYAVTIKDPEHPSGRRLVLPSFDALRSLLSDEREIDLGAAGGLPEAFTVETRVEVNPISKEQLQRTREYIAAASGARPSGSRSVLGAVASFLLREPDAGRDVHLFRSALLTRSGVAGR
ncbi:MAG TPA: hypothetical protein VFG59_01625 [Anaeromyxobacter sp.]|nr:hypothetical protein [Anaeromyxobacter sp.]